jgi:HEXXH motif-containing protein
VAQIGAEGLVVRDLTVPEEGSRSVKALLGRHARKSVEVALSLPERALLGQRAAALGGVKTLIRSMWSDTTRRGGLLSVLNRVVVSGPLHAALRACSEPAQHANYDPYCSCFVVQFLAQLSLNRLMGETAVLWADPAKRVALPRLGLSLHLHEECAGLRFEDGMLTVIGGPGDGAVLRWDSLEESALPDGVRIQRPYTPVSPKMVLSVFDTNPLSDFEAHPDKMGNQIDLGDQSAGSWAGVLAEALSYIRVGLPALRDEMEQLMQQWLPVGVDPKTHLSASYQEAVGMAYLTLHPNVFTMMEAMVHEFQHNKANALLNLEPLLVNAFHPLYTSPLRPDPRPLHGVLLAVHAFLPVAELYLKLRALGNEQALHPFGTRRLKAIVEGNQQGVEVLIEHGDWTQTGARFFGQMVQLNERHTQAVLS